MLSEMLAEALSEMLNLKKVEKNRKNCRKFRRAAREAVTVASGFGCTANDRGNLCHSRRQLSAFSLWIMLIADGLQISVEARRAALKCGVGRLYSPERSDS
jgi:hypothetical protein